MSKKQPDVEIAREMKAAIKQAGWIVMLMDDLEESSNAVLCVVRKGPRLEYLKVKSEKRARTADEETYKQRLESHGGDYREVYSMGDIMDLLGGVEDGAPTKVLYDPNDPRLFDENYGKALQFPSR